MNYPQYCHHQDRLPRLPLSIKIITGVGACTHFLRLLELRPKVVQELLLLLVGLFEGREFDPRGGHAARGMRGQPARDQPLVRLVEVDLQQVERETARLDLGFSFVGGPVRKRLGSLVKRGFWAQSYERRFFSGKRNEKRLQNSVA